MADLNEPLQQEPPVDNWDAVPEQQKARLPALAKGTYEFQLPLNLQPKHFEEVETKGPDGAVTGKYRRARFDADLPLVVTRDTTAEQSYVNQLFEGSIGTNPRPRFVGKRGDPPKRVSDAVYLYKDGLKGSTVGFKPTDDNALVDAICKLGAGKKFVADVIWPAYCNKKKVRRVKDSNGATIEDPEGKLGCGENFRDAQAENFQCKCGADIRVFPELARFRGE